ncbi:endonuclease domain-containing protein [Agrococcus jenensis]|uniref:Very-short-patch-repair endonuclease n=1 Tax=Agrococcus jenensis TaxID=46353 RepID=A0A3N2AQ12_9MICO|nr:DUF559 domain-containing protein [Agrococcus jenensis]ROR65127.1 very-short-patch-repair endonuclease [Agrococcus jenensis]
MELLEWLAANGGVSTVQAARDLVSAEELLDLKGSGAIWTPLRGWVALTGVSNDVTRALRVGGVATCVTALRMHGLWTPHGETRLHVRVNRRSHSARITEAERTPGVVVHRMHEWLDDARPTHGFDPVVATLAVASGCVSAEDLAAAAERGLALGTVQPHEVRTIAAGLPRRRRRGLERLCDRSGSGVESIFALMLRDAHIAYVQQFEPIPGMFVDFLIGTSLIVELDSRTWHGRPVDIETDRRRDAELLALGYRTLRFTYEQMLFQPELVRERVLALVRRDAHRRKLWT